MTILEKKIDVLVALAFCEDENKRKDLLQYLLEISGVQNEVAVTSAPDYATKVRNALLELGVPDSVKGHRCMMVAIPAVIENPNWASQIIKVLYPYIAEECGTTPARVERAIRHAIEITWGRADLDILAKYFGGTVSPKKGKPTNSEFIARLANALR